MDVFGVALFDGGMYWQDNSLGKHIILTRVFACKIK